MAPFDRHSLSRAILEELEPTKTSLFLGAGATIPSGAPSAEDLAHDLQQTFDRQLHTSSLSEAAGILEMDVGRSRLIKEVGKRIRGLKPSSGLLAIPEFQWRSIFTTNYDTLVESAYEACDKPLTVVRSNHSLEPEEADVTTLYKLHGCITRDIALGHQERLVITEEDYDHAQRYRENLFSTLIQTIGSGNLVTLGYSLRDYQLREYMKTAMRLRKERGSTARIFIISFDRNTDHARLLEKFGFRVLFGGIDDFMDAFASARDKSSPSDVATHEHSLLPVALRPNTTSISLVIDHQPQPRRMISGSPASYSDIEHGFTFERSIEPQALAAMESGSLAVTILGPAGVGKTTTARRILTTLPKSYQTYAHRDEAKLNPARWLEEAERLNAKGQRAVLLVDNATDHLLELNRLADGLSVWPDAPVSLLLTAERSRWLPRSKSPMLRTRGLELELGKLDDNEVDELVRLAQTNAALREFLDINSATDSMKECARRIRYRCSSDMFVALKYLFASEGADTILVREFNSLAPELQETYRLVAVMEAAGVRFRRGLALSMLGIEAERLAQHLDLLMGIVNEEQVSSGVYRWETRHLVIARIIARFKNPDDAELKVLLLRVAEKLNPSIVVDSQTVSDICSNDFGIRRLKYEDRLEVLRALIEALPQSRVPWHRLVGEHLDRSDWEAASIELESAKRAVGEDGPLRRAAVRILTERAQRQSELVQEDREALLREARQTARRACRDNRRSMHSYLAWEDLGLAALSVGGKALELLPEAIEALEAGANLLLEQRLENAMKSLRRRASTTRKR